MRVRPSQVRHILLDDSFVNALLATDTPQHTAACELYATLVDNYQVGSDRLYALSTVLGDLPTEFRRNALAPVIRLNVARQHRLAADRMSTQFTPTAALSLVMMRRERVRVIATASHDYDGLDLVVLSIADSHPQPAEMPDSAAAQPTLIAAVETMPDATEAAEISEISSRTEPMPDLRSMDESSPSAH